MSAEHHNSSRSHKPKPRRDRHDDDEQARQQQPSTRAPAVMSVEQFAHRKGVTRGLLSYKDRREKKRVETAKALRSYQKIMKREGYEAGSGASRKRKDTTGSTSRAPPHQHHDNGNGDNPNPGGTEASQNNQLTDTTLKATKKPRTNRFQKSIQESEKRQQQQEQFRQQAAEREKQKQQAVRRRRQRHKLLTARTSKGQPVMHNIVQDILTRLQAENVNRASEKQGKWTAEWKE